MFEIVRQEMYLGLFPPYYKSAVSTKVVTPWGELPNFAPIEGFWLGTGVGVTFMIITIILIYGFVKRELKLSRARTLVAIFPWLIYLGFLFTGILNIEEISSVLDSYVESGLSWRWFG